MSTPTIRTALERLLAVCDTDESGLLDIDPDQLLCAITDARAALAAEPVGEGPNEQDVREWIAAATDGQMLEPSDLYGGETDYHPAAPPAPEKTDGPAVQSREPASVAADASPTPADRLAFALCSAEAVGRWPCESPCAACRIGTAAVIRELAEQVVPEEQGDFQQFTNEAIRLNRMGTRAEILARAAELEGG